MKIKLLGLLALGMCFSSVQAQKTVPTVSIQKYEKQDYCIIGATIHVDSSSVLTNANLLVRDGKIFQVGGFTPPNDVVQIDGKGKHLYPSFIELSSSFGINPPQKGRASSGPNYTNTKGENYYWNAAIHPEYDASKTISYNSKKAKTLRNAGFGVVNTRLKDGIAQGNSTLVALMLPDNKTPQIIKKQGANYFSFRKGVSPQAYPSSLTGSVALLRQYFLDLNWYKDHQDEEVNYSLDAALSKRNLPQIFEVKNYLDALRASKLGKEAGIGFIIQSPADAYRRLTEIKESDSKFILSLDFPKPYDLKNGRHAEFISLEQLRDWELAPFTPYFMDSLNVSYAFSAEGLSPKELFNNLQMCVDRGISKEKALAALTSVPAQYLGINLLPKKHRKRLGYP